MSISFKGFNETLATFMADESVKSGEVVKLSKSGTVTSCSAGNVFCGVTANVEAGYTGVQLTGYVKIKYSGTAPSVGFTGLSADGNGGVKTDAANGRDYLVLEVDTANSLVGFLI